jgi:glycosyltransferase involved in cell wall biosynthesis
MVGATLGHVRRSGIHRVVVGAARALAIRADLHLVRYDALEGGLRHLDADEIDDLFGPGDWPPGVRVDWRARRVGRPFREGFDRSRPTWLLVPEVVWHEPQGNEKLARVISQCRAWGVRIAHILHDLIPIYNPIYQDGAGPHSVYAAELVRCDLILPNSAYSGVQLAAHWAAQEIEPLPPIVPAPLPDGGFSKAAPKTGPTVCARAGPIILVGTVEPRKRQMQVLKAFAAVRAKSAAAASRKLLVMGGMHPQLAAEFKAFVARNPWVEYRDYVSDAEIAAAYATAEFSVFASDDEGYGLPITESLTAGAPCLCANFGAMAEIAEGGGCFTVDVRDDSALETALRTLCEQPAELARLKREIAARKFKTWGDYADTLLHQMAETDRASDLRTVGSTDAAMLRRNRIAAAEAAYRAACIATAHRYPLRPIFLRLLISTYNRRDIVTANVRWLLKSVLPATETTVDLVVVDGGSADGTVEALRKIDDPRFTLVERSANGGGLAGWREAAKLCDAVYVWTIEDHAYVHPETFGGVLTALRDTVGVPLVALNFGVYRRDTGGPGEPIDRLLAKARPTATAPAPTGLVPAARVAEQHDTLFKTIYAIIWRADVLSATFDHALDGSPPASLIEASPYRPAILGEYGACDILWWGPPAIAGDAHEHAPQPGGDIPRPAHGPVGADPIREPDA